MNQLNLSLNIQLGPPPAPSNLWRVLKDQEMPFKYYKGMSRSAAPDWPYQPITPATVRILGGPDSQYKLPTSVQNVVAALDNPHGTFNYVTSSNGGWVNQGAWPLVQQLCFEDNVVEVLNADYANNRAYIRTWHGETDPIVDRAVIHHWTNIDPHGNIMGTQNPAGDGIGYIVLAYPDGVWIPLDKLEKV